MDDQQSTKGDSKEDSVRKDLLYKATMCEQAELYDLMIKCMKEMVQRYKVLTNEEQNLLSVAFKNIVGCRRTAWRVIHVDTGDKESEALCIAYKGLIEKEVHDICNQILSLIDLLLQHCKESSEQTVFFMKMKGDYFRYRAEVDSSPSRKEIVDASANAYEQAMTLAKEHLPSTNPLRLGLALNYSVFKYEIINSQKKACQLAKEAFEEAISDLDKLSEVSYRDSTLIMQLLRDNLTLWTSDNLELDNDECVE